MSFIVALEIAIGLFLMYTVVAMFCTVVNELIATIKEMLDDPKLEQSFNNHGLIRSAQDVVRQGIAKWRKTTIGSLYPSYLSSTTFTQAIIASLDPTSPIPTLDKVELAIKGLSPNAKIRDVLLAQLAAAEGDLAKFRTNVAIWFDSAMDRVSGAYKRKMKLVTIVVGGVVAIALNADTVAVGKALWIDAGLRAGVIESAKAVIERSPTQPAQAQPAQAQPATGRLADEIKNVEQGFADAQAQLRPLPIGWTGGKLASPKTLDFWYKIFGILLTTIALSLGAPFWFDLLIKFMNVRGAGEKPKKVEKAA